MTSRPADICLMSKPGQGPPYHSCLESDIADQGLHKPAACTVGMVLGGALADGAADGATDGAADESGVPQDKYAVTRELAASSCRLVKKRLARKEQVQVGAGSDGAADWSDFPDKCAAALELAASSGRQVKKRSARKEQAQVGVGSDGNADGPDGSRDKYAAALEWTGLQGLPIENGLARNEQVQAGVGPLQGLKGSRTDAMQNQVAQQNQRAQHQVSSQTLLRGVAVASNLDDGCSSSHIGSCSSFSNIGDFRCGNHSTPARLLRARWALGSGGGAEVQGAGRTWEVHGAITTAELQEAITAAADRLR